MNCKFTFQSRPEGACCPPTSSCASPDLLFHHWVNIASSNKMFDIRQSSQLRLRHDSIRFSFQSSRRFSREAVMLSKFGGCFGIAQLTSRTPFWWRTSDLMTFLFPFSQLFCTFWNPTKISFFSAQAIFKWFLDSNYWLLFTLITVWV